MEIIPILLMRKLKLKMVMGCARSGRVRNEIHSDSSLFSSTALVNKSSWSPTQPRKQRWVHCFTKWLYVKLKQVSNNTNFLNTFNIQWFCLNWYCHLPRDHHYKCMNPLSLWCGQCSSRRSPITMCTICLTFPHDFRWARLKEGGYFIINHFREGMNNSEKCRFFHMIGS